jgi:heat shock protein HtpX
MSSRSLRTMRRRTLGRDFGLSVRMLFVGGILAALYLTLFIALLLIAVHSSDRRAWLFPLCAVLLIWLHYSGADRLALRAIHARQVGPDEEPELHSVVEKLSALADIPKPAIAVSPIDAPNAFAAGTRPSRATVAVTNGLRARLSPLELEAVLGHELSHVAHRDAFIVTAASLFPTAGAYLGHWRFGTHDFRHEKRDWREYLFWPLIMALAIVLYVFGRLLTFAISRYREYAADRGSVLLTGAPEQLMSALHKISGDMALVPNRDLRAMSGLNALFIIPAAATRWEVAMDHPPLRKRLARLEEMARELGKPG